MIKRITIEITGKVQKVFFRQEAQEFACARNIVGYAENQEDVRTVIIVGEGEEGDLLAFVEWCRKGPSWAKVRGVSYKITRAIGGFENFEIK